VVEKVTEINMTNAKRTTLRTFVLMGAVVGMTLGNVAEAQVAFRSATSAFIAGGGGTPVAPTLRSSAGAVLKTGPTRLYPINVPADVNPTVRGTWPQNSVPNATRGLWRAMNSTSSSGTSAFITPSGSASPGRYLVIKSVSEPLPTAQTISGTLNWVFGAQENNQGLNAYTKLHVYVLREPDTVVGNLFADYEDGGPEWTTGAVGSGPAGGIAKTLSSVAAQAGDRIVVEAGFLAWSTRTDVGRIYYGGGPATEMTIGGIATANYAWFEFSQDLFGSVIPKPQGTVAGDVMIASISVRPNTATITPPPGWTPMQRINNTTAPASSLAIYRRTADASDSSVYGYTWTTSGATSAVGAIRTFSGVDTANPIDVENSQATVGTSGIHLTPDVTTTVANTMLVTTHHTAAGGLYWAISPSGMTKNFDVGTVGTGTGTLMSGHTVVQATAGATGTKQAVVMNNSAYPGAAHILALRGVGAGGSTTLTINKPAGVVQNDMMIASIAVGPNTATVTPPSGWALVRRTDNATASNSLAVYTKLAGASEPASYDWTLSSGHTGAAGGIMAFSGADPTIEADSGVNTPAGTASTTNPVTTAFSNTMIITSHVGSSAGGGPITWTPPSGMSETVDAMGGFQALEMNYVLQSGAGASGAKTATASTPVTGNAHILALRRALGAFNAFETATAAGAITGVIKTKIAGTTVSLDTTAVNAAKTAVASTYVGTVRIEVLDTSNNSGVLDPTTNCNSSWTLIQTLSDVTFTAADNGRKNISFTQANSYPNARLRMSAPAGAPSITACSSDNFALRPNQFTNVLVTDTDAQTAGTARTLNNLSAPGGVVHKAGRPFTVQATAVNGAGTPATTTNYTGTATATLTDCGATNACLASGFGTLTVGTSFVGGQLTSNAATYSEVGAFTMELVDSTFASVDAADGSTAAEREIHSNTPINVGRFVPDHFAVTLNTPTFGTACSGFTYVGQPFNYTVAPVITVTAQNVANVTTANYTGALWQITNASLTGKSYTAASGTVDATGLTGTDPVIADSGSGVGTLSFRTPSFFAAGTGFFFTRTNTPVAPFDAEVSLAINVIDADGVTYASNPARFGQASAGHGIAFSDGNALTTNDKQMRFGRLAVKNANGSQLVPLAVPIEAQYWGYINPPTNTVLAFITNTADSCTAINNNNVAMSGFTNHLSACETAVSGAGTLSSGRKTLLLPAPGSGNDGSVLLTLNLSNANSGTTCTTVNGSTVTATGANRGYLQGKWTGLNYDQNPSARATFGGFKGAEEVIFMRENF
jgi:hypothetical protein